MPKFVGIIIEKDRRYDAETVAALLKSVIDEVEKGNKVSVGLREKAPAIGRQEKEPEKNKYKNGERTHPL